MKTSVESGSRLFPDAEISRKVREVRKVMKDRNEASVSERSYA